MLHFSLCTLCGVLAALASAVAPGARAASGEEVPFITTPGNVTEAMLDLAGVKAGDHLIDLGSGDGRIVIAAARRGASALGVEIDPRLVAQSVENAKRAGVSGRARFLEQDLFLADLAPATVVTMYLLPEVNLQLRPAILALRAGTRIVSHDWDMGDWRPDRSVVVEAPGKNIGLDKRSRLHLWVVPARVDGLWCGSDGRRRASLRLRQSYQWTSGEIEIDAKPLGEVAGRIEGSELVTRPVREESSGTFRLVARGDALHGVSAEGALSPAKGFGWRRSTDGASCDSP